MPELMMMFIAGIVVLIVMAALLAILCAFVRFCSTSAESTGKEGEYEVARKLKRLPADEYFVLNDLMVTDARGITTQIDHVVISRFGLFVIETKCYKGWIFANPQKRFWTQSLYAGGRGWFASSEKHKFQNPIKQNWRHIYVLSERLKLPRRYFVNVVAFCGDASFKTAVPDNVMRANDVVPYICSFDKPLFDRDRSVRIYDSVSKLFSSVTNEQRENHVHMLHVLHAAAPAVNDGKAPRCPRCGAAMRLRHRRSDNAPFYGCSNYPQCHGTVDAC